MTKSSLIEINAWANTYFGDGKTQELKSKIISKLFDMLTPASHDFGEDMYIFPPLSVICKPIVHIDAFNESWEWIFKKDKYVPEDVSGVKFITYFNKILCFRMKEHYRKAKKHEISHFEDTVGEDLTLGDTIDSGENIESLALKNQDHVYILLGEKLIPQFDNYIRTRLYSKSETAYFSTFYSLDISSTVRTSNDDCKAIIPQEKRIRSALDFELIHGMFTEYCDYLRDVVFANIKSDLLNHVLSNGWFEDAIITKIKKTRNNNEINKSEVSKRRTKYKEVVGTIIKEEFMACT